MRDRPIIMFRIDKVLSDRINAHTKTGGFISLSESARDLIKKGLDVSEKKKGKK